MSCIYLQPTLQLLLHIFYAILNNIYNLLNKTHLNEYHGQMLNNRGTARQETKWAGDGERTGQEVSVKT